jgi:hypothetical protein
MINMDSNIAGTFEDSFITDSNYLKLKLVICVEQFPSLKNKNDNQNQLEHFRQT